MTAGNRQVSRREVGVASAGAELEGVLTLPAPAVGLVLFAHGSGSSRFSRRNRYVAEVLVEAGLATLLFDLLTAAEERIDALDRSLRFDIPLLSRRLIGAIDWAGGSGSWTACRSGCSAPVPVPPQPWRRRRPDRSGWPPWCPAADAPIWLRRHCRRWSAPPS